MRKVPLPLGSLRFVLAVAVVFSHTRLERLVYLGWDAGSIGAFHAGPMAVMVFCCISGYVMTMLISNHYALEGAASARARTFARYCADRALRLFPQFGTYLLVTLLVLATTKITTTWSSNLSALDLALNLLMIPLGFYLWLPSMAMLIPQAWSLGLEWCFYLVAPWLVCARSWRAVYAAGYLSMAFFLLPFFGLIMPLQWGYTLLPGVLFVFVLGMIQADTQVRRRSMYTWITVAFSVVLLALRLMLPSLDFKDGNLNKEVLAGAIFAAMVAGRFRATTASRADTVLGNLSYGVFLNHAIVDRVLLELLPGRQGTVGFFLLVVAVSTLLSAVTFVSVERPILRWRRSLRHR
jgi:peptidoglycan/LPS O-acetylase OafA/YrhL